jgi:Flp pilus assembly protein protease CpaA
MAARISAMVLMGVLAQFIPGWIMKKKNKTDLAGKKKIIVSRILAEAAFIGSSILLVFMEKDLVSCLFLMAILMLSSSIIIVDTRCRIIPNLCLFPMLLLCIGYMGRNIKLGGSWEQVPAGIFSMVMMCLILQALTAMLHFQGYLGAGDIKYLSVAAFLFSFSSRITGMLIALVISMAAYLIPMLLTKKITLKSMIAFGPFIGFGMMGGICWLYL